MSSDADVASIIGDSKEESKSFFSKGFKRAGYAGLAGGIAGGAAGYYLNDEGYTRGGKMHDVGMGAAIGAGTVLGGMTINRLCTGIFSGRKV